MHCSVSCFVFLSCSIHHTGLHRNTENLNIKLQSFPFKMLMNVKTELTIVHKTVKIQSVVIDAVVVRGIDGQELHVQVGIYGDFHGY